MRKAWFIIFIYGLLIAGCFGTYHRIIQTENIIRAIDRSFEKEDSLADSSAIRVDSTKATTRPDSL